MHVELRDCIAKVVRPVATVSAAVSTACGYLEALGCFSLKQSVCNMIYVQVIRKGPGANQARTCRQPRPQTWKCKLISGTPFLQG